MEKNQLNKRNLTADFVKGILILCVLYGHSVSMINSLRAVSWTDSVVNVFVTSFEMPLFILVSGYFLHYSLRNRPYSRALWKRIVTIAVPIVVWEGIPAACNFIAETVDTGFSVRSFLKIPYYCLFPGKLWFLGTYLYSSVAVILVEWICSKLQQKCVRKMCNVVLYAGILITLQFIEYPIVNLQFMLPFFLIGFLVAKHALLEKRIIRTAIYVLAGLFLVLYPFYKPEHSFYLLTHLSVSRLAAQLPVFLFRFVLSLCGCCGVYAVSRLMCGSFPARRFVIGTASLGERTMELYVISMYLQEPLRDLVGLLLKDTAWITDFTAPLLWGPVFLLVMTTLCWLADIIIWRLPAVHRFLFGR